MATMIEPASGRPTEPALVRTVCRSHWAQGHWSSGEQGFLSGAFCSGLQCCVQHELWQLAGPLACAAAAALTSMQHQPGGRAKRRPEAITSAFATRLDMT